MKGFRNFSHLRTRAPGSLETSPLSNRQHSATAACKALISYLRLVRLGSIAVRCRALTMPKWTPPFFRGRPGNQILSVISVMEIPTNCTPGLHGSILAKRVKSYSLGRGTIFDAFG